MTYGLGKALAKINFFKKMSGIVLSGAKIKEGDISSEEVRALDALFTRMHAGFFTSYEAVSLISYKKNAEEDAKFSENTRIHPIYSASTNQAFELRSEIIRQGQPVVNFQVLGVNQDRRSDFVLYDAPQVEMDKAVVVTAGNHRTLWECASLLEERLTNEGISYQQPLIIQDTEFWQEFVGEFSSDPETVNFFKSKNVYFLSGVEETSRLLSELSFGAKIDPEDVVIELGQNDQVPSPKVVFATHDPIKTDQKQKALIEFGINNKIIWAMNLLGRYEIPDEEEYSGAGNALFKMKVFLGHVARMGRDAFLQKALAEGFSEAQVDETLFLANDGSLSFLLENDKGERFTQIFSDPRYFSELEGVVSTKRMGPAEQLAPATQAKSFQGITNATYAKVTEVCADDTRFSIEDLCGYDVSIDMAISFKRFFELYDKYVEEGLPDGSKEHDDIIDFIAAHHTYVSADVQKIGLLRTPQFETDREIKDDSASTEHFLTVRKGDKVSRVRNRDWELQTPNAHSLRGLIQSLGCVAREYQPEITADGKINVKIVTPEALYRSRRTEGFYEMMRELSRIDPDLRVKGLGVQNQFRTVRKKPSYVSRRVTDNFGMAARSHRQEVRQLLDKHGILYIPGDTNPQGALAVLYQYLLISSAIVRQQVFLPNAPRIVFEAGSFRDEFLSNVLWLKDLGLFGQKIDHVMVLTENPEESARVISQLARKSTFAPFITKGYESNGVAVNEDCMIVSGYGSAFSKDANGNREAREIGYAIAKMGISLKTGGGKEGRMQALADGFLQAKHDMRQKGIFYPNQLILIQCRATMDLEKRYQPSAHLDLGPEDVVFRCYGTIEERRYDIQACHRPFAIAGGVGTFEEFNCELIDCLENKKLEGYRLYMVNQRMHNGQLNLVGVWDRLRETLGKYMPASAVDYVSTPEELIHNLGRDREQMIASGMMLFVPPQSKGQSNVLVLAHNA